MQQREHPLNPVLRRGRELYNARSMTLSLLLLLGVTCTVTPVAHAATPSPATQAEITHLLDYLGNSKCEFYRNGAWHAAADARKHLEKKRDYLLKRSLIGSTEDFINRAATESSISGEKYKVRCKPNPAVPSGEWLRAELRRYRG